MKRNPKTYSTGLLRWRDDSHLLANLTTAGVVALLTVALVAMVVAR